MLTFFLGSSWWLTIALNLYFPRFKPSRKERVFVTQQLKGSLEPNSPWPNGVMWPSCTDHCVQGMREALMSHVWVTCPTPSKKHMDLSGGGMDSWGNQERMNNSWPVKRQKLTPPPHSRSLHWNGWPVFSMSGPAVTKDQWDYRLGHGTLSCLRPSPSETHRAMPFLKSPKYNLSLSICLSLQTQPASFHPGQLPQGSGSGLWGPVLWTSPLLLPVLIPSNSQKLYSFCVLASLLLHSHFPPKFHGM